MVAAGSGWPPCPDPRRLQVPRSYGPLYTARGTPSPTAASPAPAPGCAPPAGRARRPPRRGAPHPAPLPTACVAHPCHTAPLTRPRVLHAGAAHAPLAPAEPPRPGASATGSERDSTRAPYWGGSRLVLLARPSASGRPPWPWVAGTATSLEQGTVAVEQPSSTLG